MMKTKHKDVKSSFFATYKSEPKTTYRLIPDYNIDNKNNDVIAHAINSLYMSPKERLNIRTGTILSPRQVHFDIMLKSKDTGFYITIPSESSDLIEGKMKTVWNKSDIRKTSSSNLRGFKQENTQICELVLKDYNFKSLSTDKCDLYPLTNMIGIIKQLKDDEKVRVNITIEPVKRRNWVANATDEYKSYKKGKLVNNEMSSKEKMMLLGLDGAEMAVNLYIEYKLLLFESLFGVLLPERKEEKQQFEIKIDSQEANRQEQKYIGLNSSTIYKLTSEAFQCKITIMSQSNDKNRAKLNMLAVANSYKDLTGDNELVPIILTKKEQEKLFIDVNRMDINTSKKCILSDKEVSKLIQLPQKTLQQEYQLESIDTREVDIPEQLIGGSIRIGEVQKQGRKLMATWCREKNILALPKVFVGAQNSGKTTAIKRTVKEFHTSKISNIVIDYIESCATSKEISEVIPDNEKVIIKLGAKDFIPSMAYNEVSKLITEDMDSWEKVRLANLISEQVQYLINAVVDTTTGELTSPMLRYLHAACMITFIKPGAKLGDVFDILRRWDKRNDAIRYAKNTGCFDNDDDIFFDLDELHERDGKGKIIGTRDNLILGITNRIITLKKNPYIKAMLKADVDTNEDFAKYIEEGKSIFIMIPQSLFPSQMVRDILTTFYISRIWLTVQMREDNADARLCNVVFDEVHQVPTTARFLSNHITEFRRHRLGLILSCHYLKQFKSLLTALKSCGASYVLIAGTEKENLEMLKEEISPFTVEEGMNLEQWHALNIINYGNQHAKFICHLPKK